MNSSTFPSRQSFRVLFCLQRFLGATCTFVGRTHPCTVISTRFLAKLPEKGVPRYINQLFKLHLTHCELSAIN